MKHRFISSLFIAVLFTFGGSASIASATGEAPCTRLAQLSGGCVTAQNSTDSTTLTGTRTTSTDGDDSHDSDSHTTKNPTTKTKTKTDTGGGSGTGIGSDTSDDESGPEDGEEDEKHNPTPDTCTRKTLICLDSTDDEDEEEEIEITIDDLTTFVPTSGDEHMQPADWIAVGLPTNFYSTAKAHVLAGSLLGEPARVRYTPVSWHWSFGDGETLDSPTPGASWEQLDLTEFSATATSHVFGEAGEYVIVLTTRFTAEYSLDGAAWTAVDGTVELESDPLEIRAANATTVLVGSSCTQNPLGPGC